MLVKAVLAIVLVKVLAILLAIALEAIRVCTHSDTGNWILGILHYLPPCMKLQSFIQGCDGVVLQRIGQQ